MARLILLYFLLTSCINQSGVKMDKIKLTNSRFVISSSELMDLYNDCFDSGLDTYCSSWKSLRTKIESYSKALKINIDAQGGYSDGQDCYELLDNITIKQLLEFQNIIKNTHSPCKVLLYQVDGVNILITLNDIYFSWEDKNITEAYKYIQNSSNLYLEH